MRSTEKLVVSIKNIYIPHKVRYILGVDNDSVFERDVRESVSMLKIFGKGADSLIVMYFLVFNNI